MDFPTREGNTLDLVLSTIPGKTSPDLGVGTSDHLSIWVDFQCDLVLPSSPKQHPVRDWSRAPWEHIRGAVKRALKGWDPTSVAASSVSARDAVDAVVADLDDTLTAILNRYVPTKRLSVAGPAPWWNRHCESTLAHKQRVWRKCSAGLLPWWKFHTSVKYARAAQKRAFASFQRKLKRRLASSDGSSKEFWSLVKELSGLEQTRNSSAPGVDDLADHFQCKMANSKDAVDDAYVPADATVLPISSLKIRYKKVLKVLKSRDSSKSANGLPPVFLKECAPLLAPAFCKLFKFVVHKAVFPSSWKIGRVTPLHKRGSVKLSANYRPVTVLDGLSTCFEAVTNDQIYSRIETFIPDNQFGFIRDCGTQDYGAAVAFPLLSALEHRNEGVLVSLDVTGAFDRCWWSRIKSRLRARGMRGRALALLGDYLRQRFIKVVASGDSSSLREIFSGVPQGALWSPSLWDFDISDLPAAVKYG